MGVTEFLRCRYPKSEKLPASSGGYIILLNGNTYSIGTSPDEDCKASRRHSERALAEVVELFIEYASR